MIAGTIIGYNRGEHGKAAAGPRKAHGVICGITIDIDEVITALAKTVAELTCSQNGANRQQIIEKLMREILDYDAEFRRDDASGAIGSAMRH